MSKVDFDLRIARKFLSLEERARSKGLTFDLSLTSIRNITKSKRCFFTGVLLNDNNRTIDRIDSAKGYVKGNVVACHHEFNQVKSRIEDLKNSITPSQYAKGFIKIVDILGVKNESQHQRRIKRKFNNHSRR